MKKIITKFSLLFIGLMLCAGNAWGAGTYHEPGTSGDNGYYEEEIGGVTYRVYYSYVNTTMGTPPYAMTQTTRTLKQITSCGTNHENDYKYKSIAYAYVTNVFNGSSPAEIEIVNSIQFYGAAMNGINMGNPTNIPVCLKKSNFNGYSGKIKLPAYPSDGNAVVYEGWAVNDQRWTDSNYGDPFTYVFGENVTVEVPKFSDQAKYEAKSASYIGNTYTNGDYFHNQNAPVHPWNGKHLTNRGETESTTISTGDDDDNWVLYANGILVVAYNGAMPDFAQGSAPWSSYASSIYAVRIGANVTSIGENAFYNCTNLTEVVFQGNNVESLGENCFMGCLLQKITLPLGVTTINANVFSTCDELVSVILPATVSNIENYAFASTRVLKEITILNPEPTTDIQSGAFNNITTLYIPDASACDYINLYSSEAWTSKVFKSETTGNVLECVVVNNSCGTDLTWEYNDGVLTISGEGTDMADYNTSDNLCPWSDNLSNITSVVLPNTLEHIGEYAFFGCTGLKEVTIPASVTEIGEGAFLGCSSLKALHMEGDVPTLATVDYTASAKGYPFEGVLDIYVPANYLINYKTEWGEIFAVVNISDYDMVVAGFIAQSVPEEYIPAMIAYLSPTPSTEPEIKYSGCQLSYYSVGTAEADDDIVGCSDNTAANTNDKLEELAANGGTLLDRFTIVRPIQANGYLNTLCLPFDMDADDIAASDLNGAEIFEFNEQQSGATVDMVLSQVTEIVAGMPYFFRYPNGTPSTPNLSELNFYDVTVSTSDVTPKTVDAGTFKLVGTLDNQLLNSATDYLFLGAANALFYPDLEGATEDELTIRPFRAYFESTGGASLAPARFVFGRQTPTDIENIESNNANVDKTIENGQLFILKNGVKYNAQGQVVK